MRQKILLDTDIGDDIDDALALAFLCASQAQLELVGVTTVFGNVEARSRQARTLLKLAGPQFARIPVAAGCGASLATRPQEPSGTTRFLANEVPDQDAVSLSEEQLTPQDPRNGVNLLIETILTGDSSIVPVAIGAMTNVAAALTLDRRIAAKIPKIVVMAGEFELHFVEWNVCCDPEAAALVTNSGISMDFVPWKLGIQTKMTPDSLSRLAASNSPVIRYLLRAIKLWQNGDEARMPSLFDPLTAMTLTHDDHFTWKRGRVTVDLKSDLSYGLTKFTEDPNGPHRVAVDVDSAKALQAFLDAILSL